MNLHTRTLSAGQSLVIDRADGALSLSFKVGELSTGTLLGAAKFKGAAGEAVTLVDGDGFTIGTENSMTPLAGITIACTTGTIQVVIRS